MVYWQKYLYLLKLLIDTSNSCNFSGKMMTPRQSSQVGDIFQLAALGKPGDAPDTNWGEAPSCAKWELGMTFYNRYWHWNR